MLQKKTTKINLPYIYKNIYNRISTSALPKIHPDHLYIILLLLSSQKLH